MNGIRIRRRNVGGRSGRIVTNFSHPYATPARKHSTYLGLSNFYRDKSSAATTRSDRNRYGDLAKEYAYLAAIYR